MKLARSSFDPERVDADGSCGKSLLAPESLLTSGRIMKMKAYESFDAYFADQSPRNRKVIAELRKLVARVAPKLAESVKWGNGCWLAGKNPVAYVYSAPDHVQFGFFRGASLKDPKGLLRGQGQYVRHVRLVKTADLDEKACVALLKQAAK